MEDNIQFGVVWKRKILVNLLDFILILLFLFVGAHIFVPVPFCSSFAFWCIYWCYQRERNFSELFSLPFIFRFLMMMACSCLEMKDINVLAGENIIYRCPASGYPQPKIAWFKGERFNMFDTVCQMPKSASSHLADYLSLLPFLLH